MPLRLLIWLPLLVLCLGLGTAAASTDYFYAGGKRYPLTPNSHWIAALYQPGKAGAAASRLPKSTSYKLLQHGRILLAPAGTPLRATAGLVRTVRVFGSVAWPIVETDEILIRFRSNVTPARAAAILKAAGAPLMRPLGAYASNGYLGRIAESSTKGALDIANALHARSDVIFSHPNFVWPSQPRFTPNDPLYNQQWYLNNNGQVGGTPGADVHAALAWDTTHGSPNITVAVIDSGIDIDHEEFHGTGKIVAPFDPVGNDTDPRPSYDPGMQEDHGTAVAGIAVANGNNSLGISGVAPDCALMPIRLIAQGKTIQDEADAFVWAAEHGADVICNSWGPPDNTGTAQPLPDSTRAAIDYAYRTGRHGKGCVIVWASGNGNESTDLDGYASNPQIINVGASTDRDKRAAYSDFGASLSLCAPSNGGVSQSVQTTDRSGYHGYSNNNYTDAFGGTSASAPLVAGVAALVLSVNPNLTTAQVRQRLQTTADRIDTATGNYDSAGHSNLYGYGRVNATRAVAATVGTQYSISGRVTTITGSALAGVTVQDTTTGSLAVTNSTGGYTIPYAVSGVNLVAVASNSYAFTPAARSLNIGTNITGIDFTASAPPRVTLTAPANGASITAKTALAARTTNDAVVQQVQFSLRNPTVTFNRSPNSAIRDLTTTTDSQTVNSAGKIGAASLTVDISHAYDGDLVITLTAPDGTNVVVWNRNYNFNQKLTMTFTGLPLGGKPVNGIWRLSVSDKAASNIGTLLSWGMTIVPTWQQIATTNQAAGGVWSSAWDTATAPPRPYVLRATAATANANYDSAESSVQVTPTKSTISGAIRYNSGVAVANVKVACSGVAISSTTDGNGRYSFAGLSNGSYTLTPSGSNLTFTPSKLTATLGSAYITNADFTAVPVETTPPVVTVSQPAVPPNNAYRQLPTAAGTATDTGSGMRRVTFLLYRYATSTIPAGYWAGGSSWTSTYGAVNERVCTGTTNWSLTLPSLINSGYYYRVTATDWAGNVKQLAGNFRIDTVLPTITVTQPAASPNNSYSSLSSAKGTSSDSGSGVRNVTGVLYRYATGSTPAGYWAGGANWTATKSSANDIQAYGISSWTLTLPPLPPGLYSFYATAIDHAGNRVNSGNVGFVITSSSTAKTSARSRVAVSTASCTTREIRLSFSGPLDTGTVGDVANYEVSVNGIAIPVESANYNEAARALTVTMPNGVVHRGDTVTVLCLGVRDARGTPVEAIITLIAQ